MEWSNEKVLEFLTLYEAEPIIWNPHLQDHKNRNKVQDAWVRIAAAFSDEVTVAQLKSKKNSLMAVFRPLHQKVNDSKRTGSGTDSVFKPNWFAYERMASFLRSNYKPRKTIDTQEMEVRQDLGEVTEHDPDEPNEVTPVTGGTSTAVETNNSTTSEKCTDERRRQRKRKDSMDAAVVQKMDTAYSIMTELAGKSQKKDQCALYAELLASKLRAFDEDTRDTVMHEIDTIVFRAKMKKRTAGASFTSSLSFSPLHNETRYYSPPSSHSSDHSQATNCSTHHSSSSRNTYSPLTNVTSPLQLTAMDNTSAYSPQNTETRPASLGTFFSTYSEPTA